MPKKYIYIAISIAVIALIAVILITLAFGQDAGVEPERTESAVKLADEPYCLLITGKDRVSSLTDVMMLVSFDPAKERICVLQIPRDTYAKYGDGGYRKINGAQKELGENGTCKLLSRALGVSIDGYLSIDLSDFRRAIDIIGGVEMELDEPLRYSDSAQGLYIDLDSGRQVLDGAKAEMLVRYRAGYARGDLGRLDMQKKFLAALFDTLKRRVNATNAYSLAAELADGAETNVNLALCTALGLEALKLDKSRLLFCTLPGEDIVSRKSGASFFVMSRMPTERLLSEYFYADGGIDGEQIFRNGDDRDFLEIYQKDSQIEMICAGALEKTKKD